MNWEESRALTPLKRDFLVAFSEHDQQFFLTGGSALGIFYLDHRRSFDLDFFTTEERIDWHVLDNEVHAVAKTLPAMCSTITASPTFRRYELLRGDEREILDFVVEFAPQVDPEKMTVGKFRVDTLREITVNKICTLIGRCELKDVVDLYFLSQHGFKVQDHFEAAKQKEGGLDPAMISFLLDQLQIHDLPGYLLMPLTIDELRGFVDSLRRMFTEMAFPVED